MHDTTLCLLLAEPGGPPTVAHDEVERRLSALGALTSGAASPARLRAAVAIGAGRHAALHVRTTHRLQRRAGLWAADRTRALRTDCRCCSGWQLLRGRRGRGRGRGRGRERGRGRGRGGGRAPTGAVAAGSRQPSMTGAVGTRRGGAAEGAAARQTAGGCSGPISGCCAGSRLQRPTSRATARLQPFRRQEHCEARFRSAALRPLGFWMAAWMVIRRK